MPSDFGWSGHVWAHPLAKIRFSGTYEGVTYVLILTVEFNRKRTDEQNWPRDFISARNLWMIQQGSLDKKKPPFPYGWMTGEALKVSSDHHPQRYKGMDANPSESKTFIAIVCGQILPSSSISILPRYYHAHGPICRCQLWFCFVGARYQHTRRTSPTSRQLWLDFEALGRCAVYFTLRLMAFVTNAWDWSVKSCRLNGAYRS